MSDKGEKPVDSVLERMFSLAHYLHPDRRVALCVTLDACEWIGPLQKTMSRRSNSEEAHKVRIPQYSIPQLAVYYASQTWERDQETTNSQKPVRYTPSPDDQLVRYIEFLILKTFDRPSAYAAVAMGRHLFGYNLNEITEIAPDHFGSDNIRRINSYFTDWISNRFGYDSEVSGAKALIRRPATEREMGLILQAREVLSPRYYEGVPSIESKRTILNAYFCHSSDHSELDRIRLIIDPRFCGFEGLVGEYNGFINSASQKLSDPNVSCLIPRFDEKILLFPATEEENPIASDRFSTLTPSELALLRHKKK